MVDFPDPVDQMTVAMDVGRPAKPERDHAGAESRMGETVDKNKGARAAVVRICVECDGTSG
jgi:hypothetical protein